MGWRDEWYPNQLAALRTLRGGTVTGSDGLQMPAISALDSIGVLSQVSAPIASAIRNFQAAQNRTDPDNVGDSSAIGAGFPAEDIVWGEAVAFGVRPVLGTIPRCSIKNYLAGAAPDSAQAWNRTDGSTYTYVPNDDVNDVINQYRQTFAPFVVDNLATLTQPELLRAVHEMVVAWDVAIKASANGIWSAGADITSKINNTDNSSFWAGIRKICTQLDVLAENPPPSTLESVKSAAAHALDESTKFAGKATAEIANQVGKLAGQTGAGFLGGFLENATIMSVVVAGIAVWYLA